MFTLSRDHPKVASAAPNDHNTSSPSPPETACVETRPTSSPPTAERPSNHPPTNQTSLLLKHHVSEKTTINKPADCQVDYFQAHALGAVVGSEREFADKPAGLRTHMFVCAASAMLMLLGDAVLDKFQSEIVDRDSISADPLRIIQAIIVGISFLGAGTIIHHSDNRVEGLTTASSILLTAGIGIAVGAGRYVFAIGIALLAVIVLIFIGRVEKRITRYVANKSSIEDD